jgi:hypothetical protein
VSTIHQEVPLPRRLGITALSALLAAAFIPQPAQAGPTYPYPWPDYSVVPVLFVPTDWSVSDPEVQHEAASITAAMTEIRSFYATNNGGKTFRLNALQVVQANSAKEAYGITHDTSKDLYVDRVSLSPGFEHLVVSELYARGYPTPPAQNQAGYATLIFAKGAGGYAGGRAYPGVQGGHAILGDWAIDSLEGDLAEWQYSWGSGKRLQTGAAAHELGHSFTLPHPDGTTWPYTSTVMGNWWDYPAIGLNNNDRGLLAANRPLFFPAPPAVPAVPSSQLAVAQNGTSIRVSWADNSSNETGFQIYDGVSYFTVGANATSFIRTGLASKKYMCFAIRSFNAAGSSAWTPYACTTTL